MTWAFIAPILLLCVSNVFMSFAWYGQFKYPAAPLWGLILAGWGIAFFEYCFAVPANHIGHGLFRRPTQDDAEGDHARCVRRVLGDLFGRDAEMESRRRVSIFVRRGLFRVQQMVTAIAAATGCR